MKKSDVIKQRIFDTAMELFAKQGFDDTTMRQIASELGIAQGGIYYHYPNKESLIHQYYIRSHRAHVTALGDYLQTEPSFERRLYQTLMTKIQIAEPHKEISRALFRTAAHPSSPMNPFSVETADIRSESLAMMVDVVEGSSDKFLKSIRPIMPEYLWLLMMGIILFWIFDNSKDSKRTFQLIDRVVPLTAALNKTLQSPLAAPFRKKTIAILHEFCPDLGRNQTKE